MAQAGDKPIAPTSMPAPQQTNQINKTASEHIEKATQKEQETPVKKEMADISIEKPQITKENVERLESDQEKMVMDLFDGKYVE